MTRTSVLEAVRRESADVLARAVARLLQNLNAADPTNPKTKEWTELIAECLRDVRESLVDYLRTP